MDNKTKALKNYTERFYGTKKESEDSEEEWLCSRCRKMVTGDKYSLMHLAISGKYCIKCIEELNKSAEEYRKNKRKKKKKEAYDNNEGVWDSIEVYDVIEKFIALGYVLDKDGAMSIEGLHLELPGSKFGILFEYNSDAVELTTDASDENEPWQDDPLRSDFIEGTHGLVYEMLDALHRPHSEWDVYF